MDTTSHPLHLFLFTHFTNWHKNPPGGGESTLRNRLPSRAPSGRERQAEAETENCPNNSSEQDLWSEAFFLWELMQNGYVNPILMVNFIVFESYLNEAITF